jgi:regulator of RNase E activity RraA
MLMISQKLEIIRSLENEGQREDMASYNINNLWHKEVEGPIVTVYCIK